VIGYLNQFGAAGAARPMLIGRWPKKSKGIPSFSINIQDGMKTYKIKENEWMDGWIEISAKLVFYKNYNLNLRFHSLSISFFF
jgi:hypothetical protein